MNRYTTALLVAFAALTIASCKKKKNEAPVTIDSPVVVTDYMELKPGNYWIYQEYELDSVNGTASPMNIYDSAYVGNDTTIGTNTYHTYVEVQLNSTWDNSTVQHFRDSLDYVVDNFGAIHFSRTDFSHIFRTIVEGPNTAHLDTITITEQMGFKDSVMTVPAGTFTTSTFRRIYHVPASSQYEHTADCDWVYAPGIGCVKSTAGFFLASPIVYELRLERYHVQ